MDFFSGCSGGILRKKSHDIYRRKVRETEYYHVLATGGTGYFFTAVSGRSGNQERYHGVERFMFIVHSRSIEVRRRSSILIVDIVTIVMLILLLVCILLILVKLIMIIYKQFLQLPSISNF